MERAQAVLNDIEAYEIDWAVGTGENMARVQNMACAALAPPTPTASPEPDRASPEATVKEPR